MKLLSIIPCEDKAFLTAKYLIEGRSPENGNFFTGEVEIQINRLDSNNPRFSITSTEFEINNRATVDAALNKLAEYMEIFGKGLKKDLAGGLCCIPL